MARKRNSSPQTQLLLEALVERPRDWRYGYDLARQTGLKSGTLYPLLMRLSDQGLLDDEWRTPEQPGKPARHVYRLTQSGLKLARQRVESNQPQKFNAALAEELS